MGVLYNMSKFHGNPTYEQRDVVKTISNMQSGKVLKFSWMFTVQPISTSKHAQNSKSFFVKAWKFSGLESAYAKLGNPTPDEDFTVFLRKG